MYLLKTLTKMAISANSDKKVQLIDSIEAYAYRTSKDLVCIKKKNLNVMA